MSAALPPPAESSAPAPVPVAETGISPGADAWRRLRRNPLAMASLVAVLLVAGSTLLAPLLSSHDPTRLHAWIGARPPGYSHPECLPLTVLAVGEPAEATPAARAADELAITAADRSAEIWTVALRRGVVRRIVRRRGAESPADLDLTAVGTRLRELDAGDQPGRDLPPARLAVGAPPPAGWFAPGQDVLLLRAEQARPDVAWRARLEGGVVRALSRDGVAAQRVELPAESVLAVRADGTELRLSYLLGTDHSGRDLFSRILFGGRISLLVGLVATVVSLLIGVVYGAVSGYLGALSPRGARADRLMMSGVDILYAVPFMFLVIVLLVNFGRNLVMLFIALGAVQWLTMARIVRGQVLSLASREFIAAARMSGSGHWRIISRHLIPNCLGPVIVYTTLTVPTVIIQESFLAYIGLSVQYRGENLDSWGALVKNGVDSLTADCTWLLVWPATAMAVTLIALNCLGDGLRDALDPQLRGRT